MRRRVSAKEVNTIERLLSILCFERMLQRVNPNLLFGFTEFKVMLRTTKALIIYLKESKYSFF